MLDETTIREAEPEDADAISALITSLASYFLADPEDTAAAAPFFATITPEALSSYITDERFLYYVAECGTELVGVLGIRDASHVYHLFVAEQFQGRGIARRLWETARRAVRVAGGARHFTVNASLYAAPVYERFGFVATGPEVYKHGLVFVPMEFKEETGSRAAG